MTKLNFTELKPRILEVMVSDGHDLLDGFFLQPRHENYEKDVFSKGECEVFIKFVDRSNGKVTDFSLKHVLPDLEL